MHDEKLMHNQIQLYKQEVGKKLYLWDLLRVTKFWTLDTQVKFCF